MNSASRRSATAVDQLAVRRQSALRVASWTLSGVAFVLGPVIGMTVDAEVGAAIWVLSAVLALLPFATHRRLESG